MFTETIKHLKAFQESIDRLAAAIEGLKELGAKHAPVTAVEIPESKTEHQPEKKPVTPKAKKTTSPESAPVVTPVTQTPPAAQPAPGPTTVSPSTTTPPVVAAPAGSFLDEDPFEAPAPVTYTVEQVRAEAIKCAGVKSEDWVKDVIRTIGNAPKISEIKPEKYAAVMARFAEGMKG
jgi:hypothetical protein